MIEPIIINGRYPNCSKKILRSVILQIAVSNIIRGNISIYNQIFCKKNINAIIYLRRVIYSYQLIILIHSDESKNNIN